MGGAATGTLFLGVYFFDKYFYYSTLGRSVNTIRDSVIVALDYKLNFEADKSDGISSLHARTAQRIYNLCRGNGGLYIKFGQQIAGIPVNRTKLGTAVRIQFIV